MLAFGIWMAIKAPLTPYSYVCLPVFYTTESLLLHLSLKVCFGINQSAAMNSFDPITSTKLAKVLRELHVPGQPLLLTNIWDPPTTSLALASPETKAIATGSFAISSVIGVADDDLTYEDNLAAIGRVSHRLAVEGRATNIPLTADLQSGYGTRLEEAIESVLELGVVGVNLEDSLSSKTGELSLMDADENAARIRAAMEVAARKGVANFVINARTDCILLGRTIEEAIERGRKYLDAGATTVFVWGGMKRGLRAEEVTKLVGALEGKVNVIYRKDIKDALSVKELADLGVARISMGSGLWREGMRALEEELRGILDAGI